MNATSHYCMNNETIELPATCPPVPTLAPETLCTCNNTNICLPGLMCNETDHTCVIRPDPCPELPKVAGPEGCYCNLSHELCNETMSSCGGPDSKCYEPAKCLEKDWSSFHMSTVNAIEVDSKNYAIEKTMVVLKCNTGYYMEPSLEDETFVDLFTVECGYDESWIGFQVCSPSLCESLDFDEASISETFWGEHNETKAIEGTIAKLQCKEDGHMFEDSLVSRYFLTCFHKKWIVSEPSLCSDNLQSCTKPKIPSCSLKGCNKLEPPNLKRISYDPDLNGYFTGSTLTVSCNNNNTPFSVFEDFDDPNKILATTSTVYNLQSTGDENYCLHDDCVASAGIEWKGKNEQIGVDCMEEDEGNFFCIKSDKIKWNGEYFIFDGRLFIMMK